MGQLILNLGPIRGSVITFMPWVLYHEGNNPWYQLNRRLGRPQSQSGHFGDEVNKSHDHPIMYIISKIFLTFNRDTLLKKTNYNI
jgi:hypothetical protein